MAAATSPGRWVVVWAVAYNLWHHLGALPGGLGAAGGGTRWGDWLDLAVPYLVVGPALAALAAARADRAAWVTGLAGAVAYSSGHGIHLAANSVANARGDSAPVHLWDEVVGHGLWYAGVVLLVLAMARAVPLAGPPTRARAGPARLFGPVPPVGALLAVATGLTWTTNAAGADGLVPAMLAVAVALAARGWRTRSTGAGRLLLLAYGLSAVLLLPQV